VADPILRQHLKDGVFFVAPGAQDMIAATLIREAGFAFAYGSGFWLTASSLGLPDAGIATYSEMVERMALLVKTSGAAVIADADTGYGGLLNVRHTVQGYEAAGVTAIQIEDQVFPKKCGHTPNRACVPTAEMVARIQVAVEARSDPNLVIIARTDAADTEGFDAARRRLDAYAAAGADLLFFEAARSEEELACAVAGAPAPNMATGGVTPILPVATLREIGFAGAIFPALLSLAAAGAMILALSRLKADGVGDGGGAPLHDFKTFCRQIGFEDVWAFEARWGAGSAGR
jgi:2-methylisocitrate lyase-like PEP mutase family enzyme